MFTLFGRSTNCQTRGIVGCVLCNMSGLLRYILYFIKIKVGYTDYWCNVLSGIFLLLAQGRRQDHVLVCFSVLFLLTPCMNARKEMTQWWDSCCAPALGTDWMGLVLKFTFHSRGAIIPQSPVLLEILSLIRKRTSLRIISTMH